MVSSRESLRASYNRQVGNRVGRPSVPHVRTNFRSRGAQAASSAATVRRVSSHSPGIKASTRRALGSSIGGASGRYNPSYQQNMYDTIYNELSKNYAENVAQQSAINLANQEKIDEDKPLWRDILGFVGLDPNQRTGIISSDSGFHGSFVGRGLNLLGRPLNAVMGGLERVAENLTPDQMGANQLQSWAQFVPGFLEGLTGRTHHGFGGVIERAKDSASGEALQDFQEAHPELYKWGARTGGMIGDFGLDPLNLAMPGVHHVLGESGKLATRASINETVRRLVGEGVADYAGSGARLGSRINPQDLIDAVTSRSGNVVDSLVQDVAHGGARGTKIPRLLSETVASDARQGLIDSLVQPFKDKVSQLWSQRASLQGSVVDAWRSVSSDFDEFVNLVQDELIRTGKIAQGTQMTSDDILKAINAGDIGENALNRLANRVRAGYYSETEDFYRNLLERSNNLTHRAPGIRFAGRAYTASRVGKGLSEMFSGIFEHPRISEFLDKLIYERAFPSRFGIQISRNRSLGVRAFEQFKSEVREFARNYSRQEARQVLDALESGAAHMADPHLDAALQKVREWSLRIFKEEKSVGARNIKDIFDHSYTYMHPRGGTRSALKEFLEGRAKAYAAHGNVGEYTLAKAREMGLKPVDSVFDMMLMRTQQGRNAISRQLFRNDLVNHYGMSLGELSAKDIAGSGLRQIPTDTLEEAVKRLMKSGEKMYLPKPMADMLDQFMEMSGFNTTNFGQPGRMLARIMGKLKKLMTQPFPGFHIKNAIGDAFMGLLDGVTPKDYYEMFKYWGLNKAGRAPKISIIKGQWDMDFDEFMRLFGENADSSMFTPELGTYESATAGSIPRNLGRRVARGATRVSETRENALRATHFLRAFRDEAEAAWRRGYRPGMTAIEKDILKDSVEQEATRAAVWRVNHYKFDYGALMPWENKLKTLGFPFYTYLRKALPTLLEQMYINPHYFVQANRFMEQNDGSAADNFNYMNIPDYIRQMGYGITGDQDEPWAITSDILPFGTFEIMNSRSPQEFAQNTLQNLNPFALALPELAAGRTFFNNQPIDSTWDYLMGKLPILGEAKATFGDNNESIASRLLNNRFGLGLPIRQISNEQQAYQQQANKDMLIDDPLQNFNRSQDHYYISYQPDGTYQISDVSMGRHQVLAHTPSLEQAMAFARGLAGSDYQQPRIDSSRPPTMNDVMTYLGR